MAFEADTLSGLFVAFDGDGEGVEVGLVSVRSRLVGQGLTRETAGGGVPAGRGVSAFPSRDDRTDQRRLSTRRMSPARHRRPRLRVVIRGGGVAFLLWST
jgi:hypothetical protein